MPELAVTLHGWCPGAAFFHKGLHLPRRRIFPRWDVLVIILSVFLLTYVYIEAKSNYHRGSILVLRCVSPLPLVLYEL